MNLDHLNLSILLLCILWLPLNKWSCLLRAKLSWSKALDWRSLVVVIISTRLLMRLTLLHNKCLMLLLHEQERRLAVLSGDCRLSFNAWVLHYPLIPWSGTIQNAINFWVWLLSVIQFLVSITWANVEWHSLFPEDFAKKWRCWCPLFNLLRVNREQQVAMLLVHFAVDLRTK